jgi:hypothetical protein
MKIITLISATALAALTPAIAHAQTAGTSASTPTTGDVSAGTYGSGTAGEDSVAISGGGSAEAADGGTASTESRAKFNDNMARQRSTATARDDDERARSMTNTHVRKDGRVRSRSMSIYKERGEKPVITRERAVSPK